MTTEVKFDRYYYPSSDAVDAVYYNSSTKRLYVVSKNNYTYVYANVPSGTFDDFQNASSAGRFWNLNVKGVYNRATDSADGAFGVKFVQQSPAKPAVSSNPAVTSPQNGTVTVQVSGTLSFPFSMGHVNDVVENINEYFRNYLTEGTASITAINFDGSGFSPITGKAK
jgi:hypothetical protein